MHRIRIHLCVLLSLSPLAHTLAQSAPHIGYIYPSGLQQGTAMEIHVGGENLSGTKEVLLSGAGIHVRVVAHAAPFSENALNMVQRKMQEISEIRASGRSSDGETAPRRSSMAAQLMAAKAADEFRTCASMLGLDDPSLRGFSAFRRTLSDPKRQPNAQISEIVTLYLTVNPSAPPGERELRLKTSRGITNPLYFHVGTAREYREREPNDSKPDNGVLSGKVMDMEVSNLESLPVVINGQIMPGDIDRFVVDAVKGMRLLAAVKARTLVPYLADAVPGWFQAILTLYDPQGNEVAFVDDFRFAPDPVLYYEIPESGKYTLEIRDSIYRGREDFVYRIALGEDPFVTGVFPLGGPAGADAKVQVNGWNLPVKEATLATRDLGAGIQQVSVSQGKWKSRPVAFAVDTLPECLDKEPNDTRSKAQSISSPTIVNGRIDSRDDWDVFRFKGRKGEQVALEVLARRLGSPLDSLLKLYGPDGKLVAANDDYIDKWIGLMTHYSDSFLCVTLPDDGTYTVRLSDTQNKGGSDYTYRLRVSPARPDFDVRVVPSTLNASAGATVPFTVHAVRRDGFEGNIDLRLRDMPKGFALAGARIPSGCDKVRLTLTIPQKRSRRQLIPFNIEGCARIGGKNVCRAAIPSEDMMQAFLWRHLVPTEKGAVAMTRGGQTTAPLKRLDESPVTFTTTGSGQTGFSAPDRINAEQVRFELDDPPKGIVIRQIWADDKDVYVSFKVNHEEPKPQLKGNLILNAFIETTEEPEEEGREPRVNRTAIGMLPAIPFEVASSSSQT